MKSGLGMATLALLLMLRGSADSLRAHGPGPPGARKSAASCTPEPGREAKSAKDASGKAGTWAASGTLLEACSCSVPCPCNFGQSPSRDYCHTVYAYRLKTGRYEGVSLDGLVFGGGEGDKGAMGFLDDRATPAQRAVFEKLALAVFQKGGASSGARPFQYGPITVESDASKFRVEFGASGGFQANVLIGRDGRKPIVVENNTTWPVDRFTKGKTSGFDYKDSQGNRLNYTGVNANLGEFTLDGDTGRKSTSRPARRRHPAPAGFEKTE